ncbi:MAG: ATP-binding cassette domain-containing protein [Verrucomicrobiae bacterium]|nr:ATP-binding cassette domain-containing protein [Verrucomicrobiae bacterium]
MIKVENLTKKYSGFTAVNDISFEVGKGEIVGFLGPNGAGKSTTMKILSCYIPPSAGSASVAGFDVSTHSVEVRRRIGYLPENVPLYTDMRVTEYLRYRAALKGVRGRRVRERVEEVKELTNLKEVERKIIGQLSKGFRQRVGLADAIVHEPDLIILDEPTIGLDPNQIRQVRQVIADLGKKHTVLLSTHILSEVEMICSRVLIINKGRIEASDTPANLQKNLLGGTLVNVLMKGPAAEVRKAVQALDGVREAQATDEGGLAQVTVWTTKNLDLRETIFNLAVERKWPILEMTQPKRTLEEVFIQITRQED